MTIPLALRLVACGLPVPNYSLQGGKLVAYWSPEPGRVKDTELSFGEIFMWERTRLLYVVATVDERLVLLPVLDDFALLGWLITEARRRLDEPHLRTRWSKSNERWEVYGDSAKWRHIVGHHAGVGATEVEALAAALEAQKVAE